MSFAFRFSLLACLASLLLAMTAAAATLPPYRIGVLYWSMNIPGQVAMRKGLEQEAAQINRVADRQGARGIELITRVAGDGPEGIERQIVQMRELIDLKPDVLVVQPTDNAALAAPLRRANQLGIPVVAYDQYISGGKLAAYVTSDNHQAGYLAGEYLASRFLGKRPMRLILVEYPLVSSTVERVNGLLDALRDLDRAYVVLKTYQAVEPVAGAQAGAAILRDFPQKGSVDAVFTVNDGGGLAVVDALARAGRKEILVASVDGDPGSVANIRKQRLTGIDSAQFCGPLGAEALKAAYAIAQGRPQASEIKVPVFPVTRETLRRYPGWMGPVPGDFTKPWPSRQPVWSGRPLIRH